MYRRITELSEREKELLFHLISNRYSPLEVSSQLGVSPREIKKFLREKEFANSRQAIAEVAREKYKERHKVDNKAKEVSMTSTEENKKASVAEEFEELKLKYDAMAEEYAACKTELEELKKKTKIPLAGAGGKSCCQEPEKCCGKESACCKTLSKGTVTITAGSIKIVVTEED